LTAGWARTFVHIFSNTRHHAPAPYIVDVTTFLRSLLAARFLRFYRTQRTAEGSVCGAVSLCFLFVYEIRREPLNGFAPNSHERRVWSLDRTSLKVKVKDQRHQGRRTAFSGPLGGLRALYVWSKIYSLCFFNFNVFI